MGAGRRFLAGLVGGAIMGAGGETDRLADSSDLAGEILRPPKLSLLTLPSQTLCEKSYHISADNVSMQPADNISVNSIR